MILYGNGSADYVGGGALAHYKLAESGDGKSKFGIEAAGRAGAVRTDYHSADLRDYLNNHSRYDFTTPYYGAHAGIGWERTLGDILALETYSKYMWTHQEGIVADVLGDAVDFDSVNSHRVRTGLRLTCGMGGRTRAYYGMAYEYEFDGKVRAQVHGVEFGVPDLTGGTSLFMGGLRFNPLDCLSVDMNAMGFIGKREGAVGAVKFMVAF